MPDDRLPISELYEALELSDEAQFPYTQNNGGTLTTYKALMTQIAAKIIEDMTFAGIDLPVSAGVKSVENTLNYLIDSVGGDPNGNISDSYDPTTAYVKGDLCIYENVLYICTAPTTGTFDPSKWTATTIDNVIGDLTALTTTDKSSLVGAVNEVDGKVTPQTITITPNTTVASDFAYSVIKVGKIVSYFISCKLTASITATGTVIASGLPKAVSDTQIPVTALSGANAGQTNQMAIMTDGKLQTRYTATATFPSGAYMLASGCYITSE